MKAFEGIFSAQGLNPGSPTLQAGPLPSEPLGKPQLVDQEVINNRKINIQII